VLTLAIAIAVADAAFLGALLVCQTQESREAA
jgi:hypothetical protein